MIDFDARVEFDLSKLLAKYRSRAKVAQVMLDEAVLKDTDAYVRYRTGVLARSARTASRIGQGAIIYDTPYAKRVYYDEFSNVTRDIHPLATPKWFEESKKKNKDKWLKAVDRILKEGENK